MLSRVPSRTSWRGKGGSRVWRVEVNGSIEHSTPPHLFLFLSLFYLGYRFPLFLAMGADHPFLDDSFTSTVLFSTSSSIPYCIRLDAHASRLVPISKHTTLHSKEQKRRLLSSSPLLFVLIFSFQLYFYHQSSQQHNCSSNLTDLSLFYLRIYSCILRYRSY